MKKLTSEELATRCHNEQPDGSHEPFCFELFRRAIVEWCTESQVHLETKYRGLVRLWVRRYLDGLNLPPAHSLDDLSQEGWLQFWRYYTPTKLNRANSLAELLGYFKLCVATTVAGWKRRHQAEMAIEQLWPDIYLAEEPLTFSVEQTVLENLAANAVWEAIEARCKDELELLVARLTFVAWLKPGQIAEQYKDRFTDVTEVYSIKRNLLSRLKRDKNLIRMCEKLLK